MGFLNKTKIKKVTARPILVIIFASLFFSLTMLWALFSQVEAKVSVLNKPDKPILVMVMKDIEAEEDEERRGEWTYCQYDVPEAPVYQVNFESYTAPEAIEPGSEFEVVMNLKNEGNVRLYSKNSLCAEQPEINIGTQYPMDRASRFASLEHARGGWSASNRIQMVQNFVEPGETFQVTFKSIAPEGDDIYREFFQPVVEGIGWLDEPFFVDVKVGAPTVGMQANIQYVKSLSLAASELEGLERNIEIDIRSQSLSAKFGDKVVWTTKISSGAGDTPTPRGSYKVLNKQELRIGGKSPHYRMPYWLGWRADGYGIHALPYLGGDGGYFWQEAMNHIGIPVSHGCIRVLPDEARELYEFAAIGTPIVIR